jgi:hypothetical protein
MPGATARRAKLMSNDYQVPPAQSLTYRFHGMVPDLTASRFSQLTRSTGSGMLVTSATRHALFFRHQFIAAHRRADC